MFGIQSLSDQELDRLHNLAVDIEAVKTAQAIVRERARRLKPKEIINVITA